jgi:DNA-binding XRE family transcriptional regulator
MPAVAVFSQSASVARASKICDVENAEVRRLMFGEQVRRLRLERGLSQMELAELAGAHRTYISSLESGRRNVSLNLIHQLADGLGVHVADLFPRH